jgi:hypothetical protein
MISNKFEFLDPTDPFLAGYPTDYYIQKLYGNMIVDFTGVKIADVNGTIDQNFKSGKSENRNQSINIEAQDRYVRKGELVELKLKINKDQFYGLQLGIDSKNFYVNEISQKGVSDEYFYTNILNEFARVQIASGESFDTDIEIMLEIEMLADGYLSQVFELESGFSSEIYDQDLKANKLNVRWLDAELEEFDMTQNTPNPWSYETNIDYYVPSPSNVDISIRDVNGKLILTNKMKAHKGWNTYLLKADELKASGIYIYEITNGKTTLSKRMILLNN